MSLQHSPIVPPMNKTVALYNELWFKIREQKNTLSKWISNIFDRVVVVEDRVNDIEILMEDFKNEIMIEMRAELREELLKEIREEMRC